MEREPQPGATEPAGADATASSRLEQAAQTRRGSPDIPKLEWVFALIGLVLVSATIAVLAWQGHIRSGAPPDITLEAVAVTRTASGYLVTVRAINRGDTTAADVTVEGELRGRTGSIEKSEMTFRYLPPRSPKKGGLFFAHDPAALVLTLTAKGYEAP